MDLYRVIGERDAASMLAAARSALAAAPDSDEWRRYALNAGLLAARSAGDGAAAQQLWQRHGPALYPDGRLSPELVMLLTMR
jgi:hypothetical protein